MAHLKENILANIAGQGWAAILQLAVVPLYLKFLGIESYGLIGFYTVLQAIIQILDLGVSPTMTREMARYSSQEEKGRQMRDFVRTLEIGYWVIGIVIGFALVCGSSLIAEHWIKSTSLPKSTIVLAVRMMGIISFFQWPFSFYQGGLMGLQRQLVFNGIKITMSTLNSVGSVLVLWLVSPTIVSFLRWQLLVSVLQVSFLAVFLWRSLPGKIYSPRINPSLLRTTWRFAAGMSGMSITAVVLTQMDKIVLSKLLSLEQFGYYILASVVAGGLGMIIAPLFNAFFPRFTALVTAGDHETLRRLYHRGSQTMAVLLLPPATVIAFFSFDVILAWTGNAETARNTSLILSLLVVGTAFNGLMNMPYVLQLSYGWTSIGLRINIFFIGTMVPLLIGATSYYGSTGAASVWLVLNTIYLFIGVPLTHRRLLKAEMGRWYVEDIGLPLMASIFICGASKLIIPHPVSRVWMAATLMLVVSAVFAGTALSAREIREWIFSRLPNKTP